MHDQCGAKQMNLSLPQTTKTARGGARELPMPQPRFIVCWVQPPRHTHTRKPRGLEGGSRDCSNAAQQCNVFALGRGVAFRLKFCGDLPVSVSASVPNSVVCEPVHQLCCGCTWGAGEVVADAVHGAHSAFRPPWGGGMHTAHCFVQRTHHGHSPVPGKHCQPGP